MWNLVTDPTIPLETKKKPTQKLGTSQRISYRKLVADLRFRHLSLGSTFVAETCFTFPKPLIPYISYIILLFISVVHVQQTSYKKTACFDIGLFLAAWSLLANGHGQWFSHFFPTVAAIDSILASVCYEA